MNFDFIIIGSGFGGSVSALRLSEKGYSVAVIEQGKIVTPADMEEASKNTKRLFRIPSLKLDGFFSQTLFKHLGIVGGVGVGGGSLVYASVLLEPKNKFYADPSWSDLGVDWQEELSPHYKTASRMLGKTPNPNQDKMDDFLRQTAVKMNAEETFGPTPMGIYFGTPEVLEEDPFFNGKGPSRTGCHLCGECITGCIHGAKNSLDKNYLYLAQKQGAIVLPERKVINIVPQKNGGFQIIMTHPLKNFKRYEPLTAGKVILSAGVLGTLELLFRCRDITKTLPLISKEMGKVVRTNSESIVGALSQDPMLDLSRGTTISSEFYPDEHTHITQNRFPVGYTFMKWYFGPLVNHDNPVLRAFITIGKILCSPSILFKNWFAKNWHKRTTILTVMQNFDNQISLIYGRSCIFLFLKRRLKSKRVKGKEAPSNLPVANIAATFLAKVKNGIPLNVMMESIGNLSFTAHILGGCNMGSRIENGVIDSRHEIFGYKGLYVIDGASISANVGVNPSLTIAAMAERAVHLIPEKKDVPQDFFIHGIDVKKESVVMILMKKILLVFLIFIGLNLALTSINIIQKGGGYDGRTMEQILGIPIEKASKGDVENLSKSEIMQLFYAAHAPEFSTMNGEYKASTLPVGIMAPFADYFTHHFFGPGYWEGKAFFPQNKDRGWGYNLFTVKKGNPRTFLARERKMDTWVGQSEIDDKDSFHLVYKDYNGGFVHSMHDEVRKINDTLFICMGYMAIGGGSINPAPFILHGKPSAWVGPDTK